MLVWIASYPGSLDHLLLHALHQRFGICWYEADLADHSHLTPAQINTPSGQRAAKGKWRKFYEKSMESDRLVIARTRMPPTDDLPFIYVSREGSAAIRAFYHQQVAASQPCSLASTILGHYLYGDWTSHHAAWKARSQQTQGRFIRIEDFFSDPELVIQEVLNLVPAYSPPADSPSQSDIDFAWIQWEKEFCEYSAFENHLFSLLHGDSARERGYLTDGTSDRIPPPATLEFPPGEVMHFVNAHRKSVALAGKINEMTGFIDSLQAQLQEETGRLKDYIEVLKENSGR